MISPLFQYLKVAQNTYTNTYFLKNIPTQKKLNKKKGKKTPTQQAKDNFIDIRVTEETDIDIVSE